MKYKIVSSGVYGEVAVSREDFNNIPIDLYHNIESHLSKYMNANEKETEYLKSIGCYDDIEDPVFGCVDWFKINPMK